MKHAPAFLAIVNDAKTRVKELDFREVKKRLDAGENSRWLMFAKIRNGRAAMCLERFIWARA